MMRQTGVEVVAGREEGRGLQCEHSPKIMTQSLFLFLSGDFSLPSSQSGVPWCLEVKLGLPGFENRVLFVKRAKPAQSE